MPSFNEILRILEPEKTGQVGNILVVRGFRGIVILHKKGGAWTRKASLRPGVASKELNIGGTKHVVLVNDDKEIVILEEV